MSSNVPIHDAEFEPLVSDPTPPAEGGFKIYPKSDGWYGQDALGTVFQLGSTSDPVGVNLINVSFDVVAGQNLSKFDAVFINPSDNKAYKIDIDSSAPLMGPIRGFVAQDGGIALGATGSIVVQGVLPGFSLLTPWRPLFAATSAGSYTQIRPGPLLGGSQVAIAQLGYAVNATTVIVDPQPVSYMKRTTLADGESQLITHHSDPEGRLRQVKSYISTTTSVVVENYPLQGDANLDDDLSVWFDLDELSGSRYDSVSNIELTDNNTVSNDIGVIGNAAHFEESRSETLSAPKNSAFDVGSGNFTLSAWAKVESFDSSVQVIAMNGESGAGGKRYFLYADGDLQNFKFQVDDDVIGVIVVTDPTTITLGTWYHVVGIREGDTIRILVNAVEVVSPKSISGTGNIDGVNGFSVGGDTFSAASPSYLFDGSIDEVALWKRVLTDVEIKALYNNGSGMSYADVLAYTENVDTDVRLRYGAAGGTLDRNNSGAPSAIEIGDTSGNERKLSQQFTPAASGTLTEFKFTLGNSVNSPTGGISWEIREDSSDEPGALLDDGGPVVVTASAENTVSVPSGPVLHTSQKYWLILKTKPQTTNTYYKWQSSATATYPDHLGGYEDNDSGWVTVTSRIREFEITTSAITANDKLAQSFTLSAGETLDKVRLQLKKVGSPTGTMTLRIETDNAGEPSGTLATVDSFAELGEDQVGTDYAWVGFNFDTQFDLLGSTTYWIVLSTDQATTLENYVAWGADSTSPSYANGEMKRQSDGAWAAESKDAIFEIYGEGVTFDEPAVIGRSSGGTRDIAVRYDDGTGSNGNQTTTFENTSGVTLDVTSEVVL